METDKYGQLRTAMGQYFRFQCRRRRRGAPRWVNAALDLQGAMRVVVILLAAIALGACLPDRAKDMAVCQAEALRFYPSYFADKHDSPGSRYVIACMAIKGHEFTTLPVDCNSRYPMPTQPACYTPNGWFAWMVEQIRRGLERFSFE